ncbi:uncharacterized protein LOC135592782 isoform X1 [Musa acuminata AAA Group]|uniref:uncharacterized protein LOC135592782 isoform X1 n=1 Tax=Musa acuminata AAA Group TaxID=214697 RepID=UPI0031E2FCCF
MEKLRLDLMKEAEAVCTEDDELYEEIEAPKFVDFTVPDRFRPDDRSWFCARVGCDQTHEEVDPEALYRTFLLRVMAARSPNVRHRKALGRPASSLIPRCPQSAPAKSSKSRIARLSTMIAVPESTAKSKLKDHPISSLRSTPSRDKAKPQHCPMKEALTEPRRQRCLTNREGFRSVRHQKEPVPVVKNKAVVRSLFDDTTKERPLRTTTPSKSTAPPVSEDRPETRKLKVGSRMKNVPSRYLCIPKTPMSSKRAEDSAKSLNRAKETKVSTKLKTEPSSKICDPSERQEISRDGSNDMETDGKLSNLSVAATNVEEPLPSLVAGLESLQLAKADSTNLHSSTMENCEKVTENEVPLPHASSKRSASEAGNEENSTELDDNKENASDTNKGRYWQIYLIYLPFDATLFTGKILLVLLLANDDRVLNSNAKRDASEDFKSAASENVPPKVLRPQINSSDRVGKHKRTTNPKPFRLRIDERGILKEANQERRLRIEAQAQKQAESTLRTKALVGKEKIAEKPQSRLLKMASSRQTLEDGSVTALRKAPVSQTGRENCKTTSPAVTTLKAKRPAATVAREPNFHRIHLPKGCSKRVEVQQS